MAFLRGGPLDDRRRRLLSEETKSTRGVREADSDESPAEPRRAAATNTRETAYMDSYPRLIDLIPHKRSTLAILFLAGIAVVAGLETLYHFMPQWSAGTTDGRIAAFDLDGEGSLAVWFSSTTLSAAGLVALLIYAVRQHKADDFHGHYRVWLWASAVWFLMSIDECGSLHEGFKELMTVATGQRLLGDGSVWWIGAYGLLGGAIGLRLLLEMRVCWSSTSTLVLALGCYVVAIVTQLQFILPESGARGVMLEEGCEMVGNLLLLLSMLLHARYVTREAEGLTPAKASKTQRKSREDSAPAKRNDLAATKSGPLASAVSRAQQLRVDADADAGARRLSKAERKAMRRQHDSARRDEDDE